MSGLLVLLVGAVVATPTGVSISISPAGQSLGVRIALGLAGLVGACLPPAVLTYAWYTARLRAWGRGDKERLREDMAQGRRLADAPAREMAPRRGDRTPARRPDDA